MAKDIYADYFNAIVGSNISDEVKAQNQAEVDALYGAQNTGALEMSLLDKKRLTLQEQEERKKLRLGMNQDKDYGQDSDLTIKAKEAYNWVNDFWEDDKRAGDFKVNIAGKQLNTGNTIFEDADTTIEESQANRQALIDQYNAAEDDPNAKHKVYQLRLLDGYDETGNPLYTYKTGIAKTSAAERYKNQAIENGYEILSEKGFADAEEWENQWHGNKANIADRTYFDDKTGRNPYENVKDIAQLRSGMSEVYNTQHFNKDITPEQIAENQAKSEALMNQRAMQRKDLGYGATDGVVDAFQAGAAKAVTDTGDFILDVLTPGDNTWLNNVKDQKNIDKFVGYNRENANKAIGEATGLFNQGKYVESVWEILKNPQIVAESVPMMLEMTVGFGKFSKLGKMGAELLNAQKAGNAIKAEELTKKISDSTNAYTKASEKLLNNAGFLGVVGGQTNNQLEERSQLTGQPPSATEVMSVFASNLALLGLDRFAFDKITGLEGGKKLLGESFGFADAEGKKRILQGLGKYTAGLATAGAAEGLQEYIQTWGEILNKQGFIEGGKSLSEIISSEENINEAIGGAMAGIGGGIHMKAGADVINVKNGDLKELGGEIAAGINEVRQNNELNTFASNIAKEGLSDIELADSDADIELTTAKKSVIDKGITDIESIPKAPGEETRVDVKAIRDVAKNNEYVEKAILTLDSSLITENGISAAIADSIKSDSDTSVVASTNAAKLLNDTAKAYRNLGSNDAANKLEELLVQDENGVLYVDSNAEAKTISNEIAKSLALQLNRDVSETKKANSDLTAILSSYNLNSDTFAQPIANFNAQASIGYQKAISKMLSSESSDFATRIKKQGKFKEAITNAQSKTNVNTKSTDELFSKIKEASFGSLGSINDSIKSSNINDLQKLSEKISTIDTDKDPVSSKNLVKIQKLIDREIKSRDKTFNEAKYTSTYESVVDKDLVGKVNDFTNGKSSKQVSEELNSDPKLKALYLTPVINMFKKREMSVDERTELSKLNDEMLASGLYSEGVHKNINTVLGKAKTTDIDKDKISKIVDDDFNKIFIDMSEIVKKNEKDKSVKIPNGNDMIRIFQDQLSSAKESLTDNEYKMYEYIFNDKILKQKEKVSNIKTKENKSDKDSNDNESSKDNNDNEDTTLKSKASKAPEGDESNTEESNEAETNIDENQKKDNIESNKENIESINDIESSGMNLREISDEKKVVVQSVFGILGIEINKIC